MWNIILSTPALYIKQTGCFKKRPIEYQYICTHIFWIWVTVDWNMCEHFLIGEFIRFCKLYDSIQHKGTAMIITADINEVIKVIISLNDEDNQHINSLIDNQCRF